MSGVAESGWASSSCFATNAKRAGSALENRLRHAAIKAERQELIRLWRENEISDEVLHHLEEILDYQEAHL
ncbi:MAG: hypothetical protein Q8M20_00930 [Rhodocyclaceae bacterium]|nr:hypothetical protein [Rhodocyclaceae bacterium]MDZ4214942.1 hypothetical protein [Rhodocyclaceae bacterium]